MATNSQVRQLFSRLRPARTHNPSKRPRRKVSRCERLESRMLMAASAAGDFNGDGYTDVVQAEPTWSSSTGRVSVIYGRSNGLNTSSLEHWYQGKSDGSGYYIKGSRESGDQFGNALAVGDFDGDGVDDLAIGVAREDVYRSGQNRIHAGAVNIIYGKLGSGLSARGNDYFTQEHLGDRSDDHEAFGTSLAAGDYNGDGVDDLAVGVPQQSLWVHTQSYGGIAAEYVGAVDVIFGRQRSGLTTYGSQRIEKPALGTDRADRGIMTAVPYGGSDLIDGDQLGGRLASGDFNGDGIADLAMSSAGDYVGQAEYTGSVYVGYGVEGAGFRGARFQAWNADVLGHAPTAYGMFGREIVVGDFDGDQNDDIAIAEDARVGGVASAGAVYVIYGSETPRRSFFEFATIQSYVVDPSIRILPSGGLKSSGHRRLTLESLGLESRASDHFGSVLEVGRFDGDEVDDLAIGVQHISLVSSRGVRIADAGAVFVTHGSEDGLDTRHARLYHQDIDGVLGRMDSYDRFGKTLLSADLNNDGRSELIVGVNDDGLTDLGFGKSNQNVFYGGSTGLLSSPPIRFVTWGRDMFFRAYPYGTSSIQLLF